MRFRLASLVVLGFILLLTCCGKHAEPIVPKEICGTPIDPQVAHAVVEPAEGFHEFNRVDRGAAITAPCVLLSGNDPVLEFRFSWDRGPTNLMYLASGSGSVSRVTAPQRIPSLYTTLVGTDGAISTAPCGTKGGDYFTLTLQLPRIELTDRSHRGDIEKFMRAYFPATLKTLGCRTAPPASPRPGQER